MSPENIGRLGINALVAESLNSFITAHVRQLQITLEQSLDMAAGKVDVFPRRF